MSDLDGVVITSKYCYHTTKLGYCGPKELSKGIYQCARYGAITTDIENAMKGFAAFPIYYNLISSSSEMPIFSEEVAEAYWLGNELSFGIKTKELREHLQNTILKLPVYRERLEKRVKSMPNGCIPTHNFHVLVLGSVTGVLKETVENLNRCIVNIGEVKEKNFVVFRPLVKKSGGIAFGRPVKKKVKFDFCDANTGDNVSIHWGYVVQKLDKRKSKNLDRNLKTHVKLRNKMKL